MYFATSILKLILAFGPASFEWPFAFVGCSVCFWSASFEWPLAFAIDVALP